MNHRAAARSSAQPGRLLAAVANAPVEGGGRGGDPDLKPASATCDYRGST
jgi:hypothetical protein